MKRSLIWFFLAMPMLCAAQSNYLNGYIIKDNQDTLKGYVDYLGRIFTPAAIKFKKELNEKTQGYTVEDCAGFGIDNKEYFERYTVNISQAYTRVSNLKEGLDTSFIKETVFLKVLSRGKNVTLFSYTDEIKERFYLKSNQDAVPYELFRAQYLEKNSYSIKGDYRFRNQIRKEMSGHDGVGYYNPKKLELLRYEQEDLVKVVFAINGQKVPKVKPSGIRVFAGAGISASLPKYSKNGVLGNDDNVFSGSYVPMINGGLDVFLDPSKGKYLLRFEAVLLNSKNNITKGYYVHSFDQTSIVFAPQVVYNFYQKNKFQAYAGIGVGLSLSSYRNNKAGRIIPAGIGIEEGFEEREVEFVKFNIISLGKIGAVINKRIEVSMTYMPPSKITDYVAYSISMQRMTFGVNYLFGN